MSTVYVTTTCICCGYEVAQVHYMTKRPRCRLCRFRCRSSLPCTITGVKRLKTDYVNGAGGDGCKDGWPLKEAREMAEAQGWLSEFDRWVRFEGLVTCGGGGFRNTVKRDWCTGEHGMVVRDFRELQRRVGLRE